MNEPLIIQLIRLILILFYTDLLSSKFISGVRRTKAMYYYVLMLITLHPLTNHNGLLRTSFRHFG